MNNIGTGLGSAAIFLDSQDDVIMSCCVHVESMKDLVLMMRTLHGKKASVKIQILGGS